MKAIKRNLALEIMSVKETPSGAKNIYSIKFIDLKGIIRFFPKAYSCGAGKMNNYNCRVRGVQPCCESGYAEGHPYPVGIDRIVEFNGMRVEL